MQRGSRAFSRLLRGKAKEEVINILTVIEVTGKMYTS